MSESAFTPTCTAPADGLLAWNVPEADRSVVGQIRGGTPLELVDARGDAWRLVRRADGLTGWVDGSQLQAIRGGAAGRRRLVGVLLAIGLLVLLVVGVVLYVLARITQGQPTNIFTSPG